MTSTRELCEKIMAWHRSESTTNGIKVSYKHQQGLIDAAPLIAKRCLAMLRVVEAARTMLPDNFYEHDEDGNGEHSDDCGPCALFKALADLEAEAGRE